MWTFVNSMNRFTVSVRDPLTIGRQVVPLSRHRFGRRRELAADSSGSRGRTTRGSLKFNTGSTYFIALQIVCSLHDLHFGQLEMWLTRQTAQTDRLAEMFVVAVEIMRCSRPDTRGDAWRLHYFASIVISRPAVDR
jgi:hypothetical protein